MSLVNLSLVACDSEISRSDQARDRTELRVLSGTGKVSAEEVARLSFVGLDVAPDAAATVFRLPCGGWGVSSELFGGLVQRFDSSAAAAGTFGRSGEGPGEFGGKILGATVNGEFWAIDPANGRLTVYSSKLDLLTSRPLPGRVFSIAPTRQDAAVIASGFFHSIDATWSVGRFSLVSNADAFGHRVPETPASPRVWRQYAVPTTTGEVWSIASKGGAIDVLRSDDLSTIGHFVLPGVPHGENVRSRVSARQANEPPSPQVIGIAADEDSLVWVLIGVPDADWTPSLDDDVDGIHSMFDTVVLAIDPLTRALVGEKRLDAVCLPAGGSLISCVHVLDQVISVSELRLQRGAGEGAAMQTHLSIW